MATENEPDPVADFAEAVGNGQIHPAVAGMLAHLDSRLSDILDSQDRDKQPADDDDELTPDEANGGPKPTTDDVPDKDKPPAARKVTPAAVADKGGNRR